MAADQNKGDVVPPFLLQLLQSAAAHHSSGDLKNAEQGYLRLLDHGYRKADILLLLAQVVANEATWKRLSAIWTKCSNSLRTIWMP